MSRGGAQTPAKGTDHAHGAVLIELPTDSASQFSVAPRRCLWKVPTARSWPPLMVSTSCHDFILDSSLYVGLRLVYFLPYKYEFGEKPALTKMAMGINRDGCACQDFRYRWGGWSREMNVHGVCGCAPPAAAGSYGMHAPKVWVLFLQGLWQVKRRAKSSMWCGWPHWWKYKKGRLEYF